MCRKQPTITAAAILVFVAACMANPFLEAPNDQPVSAKFRGTEWSDDIGDEDIPLTAQVVTTRLARMSWGAIFKIEFTEVKSRAEKQREIPPDYFIVTDDRIILLNEENNDAAVKKISAMDEPPPFEESNIRGITSGKFNYAEGPWTTAIGVNGDQCTYLASHNSGHFTKLVWKKGVGLVEYATGYGAHADGCRLKRVAIKQKQ
jgi:hypothetical protein